MLVFFFSLSLPPSLSLRVTTDKHLQTFRSIANDEKKKKKKKKEEQISLRVLQNKKQQAERQWRD